MIDIGVSFSYLILGSARTQIQEKLVQNLLLKFSCRNVQSQNYQEQKQHSDFFLNLNINLINKMERIASYCIFEPILLYFKFYKTRFDSVELFFSNL